MVSPRSGGTTVGTWRRNPLVGVVAALVILVGVWRLACRPGERGGSRESALPPTVAEDADEVPRYCPHCKKFFILTRAELEKMPGDEPLAIRARRTPCPHCGQVVSIEALRCAHCGELFAPPLVDRKGGAVCPDCGKNPYGP